MHKNNTDESIWSLYLGLLVIVVTKHILTSVHLVMSLCTGKNLPSNAFLSPRWGGVLIYNVVVPPAAKWPISVDVDMRQVMEVFLTQLRLLLNIQVQASLIIIFFPLFYPNISIINIFDIFTLNGFFISKYVRYGLTVFPALKKLLEFTKLLRLRKIFELWIYLIYHMLTKIYIRMTFIIVYMLSED